MAIRTGFAITMALTWGLALGASGASEAPRPAITIRVANETSADGRSMALARKEAVRIFAQAGIDLVWLDCVSGYADYGNDDPCHHLRGAVEFWVRIVSRRPPATTVDVIGFSDLDKETGDGSAGVYYPAAVDLAKRCQARAAEVLGAAIAHEVGHLIMGANAHSSVGVMQASWGRAQCLLIETSDLNFTAEQAKRLRERVDRREGLKSRAH